jgi:hypothetical protein
MTTKQKPASQEHVAIGTEVGLRFKPRTFRAYTTGTVVALTTIEITIASNGCRHSFRRSELARIDRLAKGE